MSQTVMTACFVLATFTLYIAIAFWSRVKDTRGFYVAGRGVPAVFNGMATAADWMSAASFLSMAGLIALARNGFDGAIYLLGWTGGYVLLALLLAPYLRKFGKYTVPAFIGERYQSEFGYLSSRICGRGGGLCLRTGRGQFLFGHRAGDFRQTHQYPGRGGRYVGGTVVHYRLHRDHGSQTAGLEAVAPGDRPSGYRHRGNATQRRHHHRGFAPDQAAFGRGAATGGIHSPSRAHERIMNLELSGRADRF